MSKLLIPIPTLLAVQNSGNCRMQQWTGGWDPHLQQWRSAGGEQDKQIKDGAWTDF